ncbi:MAG: imidazole glycerol phosphate synthase subunit HisH [Rickettsiales bacterium]|nr:imidazole glycerol phosphate synthase subunit HisH [Rickettsiales bacterium]|tara:strand:- start:1159 stop:1815 length:657 start_codon:yes stop_codon:yes gene_type:complete
MKLVSIIDYGCGNIRSVFNAFNAVREKKNIKVLVTNNEKEIRKANYLVLPGVGAFESCIKGLIKSNLLDVISFKVKENGTPFLGICVGMQMLATRSFENGEFDGLNWIEGEVKKLDKTNEKLKIPHMGWSDLNLRKETIFTKKLKAKLKFEKVSAYFVHSYNFLTRNESDKIMTTNYEQEITAMVSKKNIIGTQFHPEKSNTFGLIFLETFLELDKFV